MTKHTAPAADEGLPNINSGGSNLIETEHGLSVCRPLKSLKVSVLPPEELDEFMKLLDRYAEFGDLQDVINNNWKKVRGHSDPNFVKVRDARVKAYKDQKDARRDLIGHLKIIRNAPAKTLDDILFKAEICAVLEPWDVERCRTLPHSIINDLLSAGCTWMQPSANE
jgi:hypothetical protein